MIIYKNSKGFAINSMFPKENFTNDDNVYIVDETTEEGKLLKEKIVKNHPFYDLVIDENDQLIDVQVYPDIEFTIDKTQITTTEVATITIIKPSIVIAVIDGQEYEITDGIIEFSHYKAGKYEIMLKADKFKPTIITIEVI